MINSWLEPYCTREWTERKKLILSPRVFFSFGLTLSLSFSLSFSFFLSFFHSISPSNSLRFPWTHCGTSPVSLSHMMRSNINVPTHTEYKSKSFSTIKRKKNYEIALRNPFHCGNSVSNVEKETKTNEKSRKNIFFLFKKNSNSFYMLRNRCFIRPDSKNEFKMGWVTES